MADTALTPARKCAILLMLLEETDAAAVIASLNPAEIEAVGAAMLEVADIDRDALLEVVEEFLGHVAAATSIAPDQKRVRGLLVDAVGEDRAVALFDRIGPAAAPPSVPELDWLGSRALARFIVGEHPQVGAAVLSLLPAAQSAAAVLAHLEADAQAELLLRIAALARLGDAAIPILRSALGDVLGTRPLALDAAGGVTQTIDILKAMPGRHGRGLLAAIRERDAALAGLIEERMLVFEDLMAMPDQSLGMLVQSIDGAILALALRGADAALRARVLAGMSTRAAQSLEDELGSAARVKRQDIEAAQAAVIARARALAEAGEIVLRDGGDDV